MCRTAPVIRERVRQPCEACPRWATVPLAECGRAHATSGRWPGLASPTLRRRRRLHGISQIKNTGIPYQAETPAVPGRPPDRQHALNRRPAGGRGRSAAGGVPRVSETTASWVPRGATRARYSQNPITSSRESQERLIVSYKKSPPGFSTRLSARSPPGDPRDVPARPYTTRPQSWRRQRERFSPSTRKDRLRTAGPAGLAAATQRRQ